MFVKSLLNVILVFVVLDMACSFRLGGCFGSGLRRSQKVASLACQREAIKDGRDANQNEFDRQNKKSLPKALQDLLRWDKDAADDVALALEPSNQSEVDSLNRSSRYSTMNDHESVGGVMDERKNSSQSAIFQLTLFFARMNLIEKLRAETAEIRAEIARTRAYMTRIQTELVKVRADVESWEAVRRQREAEAYDMRLLGNLQRLFIYEVVDPIMAMSWEVAEDTRNETAFDRSYFAYLEFIEQYAAYLVCKANPNDYNNQLFWYGYTLPTEYNATARMERVDRALFPVTGVRVLDLALARNAYLRNTMKHWECMYTTDAESLDKFVTECEQCEWRDEWRGLGTKMTRAVRAKLDSNKILRDEGYDEFAFDRDF